MLSPDHSSDIDLSTELSVRTQELAHGAAACVTARPWTLRALVAFLFDGRECADVRELLAVGHGVARGSRLTWPPLSLTAAQLTAIERSFPRAQPERRLVPAEVTSAQLIIPADAPRTAVSVRATHPVIADVVLHASYVRFDFGPWADLYTAALTRDQALALLADTALGVTESAHVELAAMLAEETDAAVRLVAPRSDEHAPW